MGVTDERVASLVAPIATELDLDVYDVEFAGGSLRVLLQRPGGVGLDDLAEATRRISRALDEADVVAGSYTLEVSSPGLERNLRTPAHYAGALGELVTVKTRPDVPGERRVDGVLSAADEASLTVTLPDGATRTVALEDVARARTRFEWGAAPKPGGPGARRGTHTDTQPAAEPAPADRDSEASR